jgi:AcrR family transcriptional regulator
MPAAAPAVRTSPAAVPLSRRERRRHEIRTRILESAMRLFDEKGFQATTVAEICDAADVAQKTFFNHFASKPDMLREVARVWLEVLLDLVADARTATKVRDRIEAFFRACADMVEQAGPMRRELVTALVHLAHESGTGGAQARTIQGAFAALLDDGAARGKVGQRTKAAPGTDTAVEVLLGSYYALMLNWANIEGYPFRKRATAMARFLGDTIDDASRRKR